MTGEQGLEGFQRWIADVLEQLGWNPGRQLEYIHSNRVGVDEIALQFDDAFHLVQGKMHDGLLNGEAFHALLQINAQLNSMTEASADLWSEEALATAPEWRELRIAAERAKSDFERALR